MKDRHNTRHNTDEKRLTICISNLTLIFKASSNSNAKNHKEPIDIWNIYLAKELFRCMNNFDSWETAMSKSLLND